jgi:hypothetical protein
VGTSHGRANGWRAQPSTIPNFLYQCTPSLCFLLHRPLRRHLVHVHMTLQSRPHARPTIIDQPPFFFSLPPPAKVLLLPCRVQERLFLLLFPGGGIHCRRFALFDITRGYNQETGDTKKRERESLTQDRTVRELPPMYVPVSLTPRPHARKLPDVLLHANPALLSETCAPSLVPYRSPFSCDYSLAIFPLGYQRHSKIWQNKE